MTETEIEPVEIEPAPACPFCHGTDVQALAEGYFNCPTCDTEFDEDEL
jgi:ribosomal protein L37AE/L43A